jgi:hypothetical protein
MTVCRTEGTASASDGRGELTDAALARRCRTLSSARQAGQQNQPPHCVQKSTSVSLRSHPWQRLKPDIWAPFDGIIRKPTYSQTPCREAAFAHPSEETKNDLNGMTKLRLDHERARALGRGPLAAEGESIITMESEYYHVKKQNNSLATYTRMQDNELARNFCVQEQAARSKIII